MASIELSAALHDKAQKKNKRGRYTVCNNVYK